MVAERTRGFTLVEVLVALAILGLTSTLLAVALRNSQLVLTRVVGGGNADRELVDFQNTLRLWLGSAHPFPPNRTPGQTIYALHGTSNEIIFSAPLTASEGQNDLYRIKIYLDGSSKSVSAGIEPDRFSIDVPSERISLSLIRNVEALEFSYLDWEDTDNWHATWEGRDNLPAAIKVSIAFLEGDAPKFHMLAVYLKVTGQQICRFDPVVRRCR